MRHHNPDNSAMEEMRPVARTSLSDEIVSQIIDLISRDVLKPGERLPSERELCKQFGVGRSSLREALRSLSVLGILDGRVGDGTFVSNNNEKYLEKALQWSLLLDQKKIQDLIETRLMLESQTAFFAAQRASSENIDEIERNLRGMESSIKQPEKYLEYDVQFHLTIAQATQNSILYSLLNMTRSYLQTWIKGSLDEPSAPKAEQRAILSVREHQKILQPLRKGNAEDTQQAMTQHILSSSVALQTHFEDRFRTTDSPLL